MQGTGLRYLVWEDLTCCGATKPVHHNYWACVPQVPKPACPRARAPQLLSPRTLGPVCSNCWARMLQLLKPVCLEPVLHNKRSHCSEKSNPHSPQLEKTRMQQQRPNAAKKKKKRVQRLKILRWKIRVRWICAKLWYLFLYWRKDNSKWKNHIFIWGDDIYSFKEKR